jgi:hypothetical protein
MCINDVAQIASLNRGIFLPSVAVGYKTFSLYQYAQFTDYSLSSEISKIDFENSYVYPYRISSAESYIQVSPIFCCIAASSSVFVDSLYFVMLDVMLITIFDREFNNIDSCVQLIFADAGAMNILCSASI